MEVLKLLFIDRTCSETQVLLLDLLQQPIKTIGKKSPKDHDLCLMTAGKAQHFILRRAKENIQYILVQLSVYHLQILYNIIPYPGLVGVSGRWSQSIQQGGCQDCTLDAKDH